jgi:hypothetical protein
MKIKKSKTRNTKAKAIASAAQSENTPYKAHEIAFWGRSLTSLEDELNFYYACKAGLKTENAKRYEGGYAASKSKITAEFLFAIDTCDSKKIQDVAEAVRFFKDVKRPEPESVDRERAALLELKILFGGQKMMLPKVAKYLVRRGIMTEKAFFYASNGGFSALRRKCKQLNIPLVDSRKISRK